MWLRLTCTVHILQYDTNCAILLILIDINAIILIYTPTTSILKINISQHAIREGRNIRLSLKNSTTGRNEAKNEAKQGYKCVSWTCQLLFIIVLAFLVFDVLVSSTHYSVVMGPCRDWERDCKNFVETGDISPESSSGTSVHLSNPSD